MRRYFPDIDTFRAAAQRADVVPVYRQLLADRLTPVSAFELLAKEANHAFLLESVVGGEQVARHSFIATNPLVVYEVTQRVARVTGASGGLLTIFVTNDPLADLQRLLGVHRYHRDTSLPAFTGGLVGYAGYDTIRYYEGEKLPKPPSDDRKLPVVLFGLYNELVIFDHVDKTIKVVANAVLRNHELQDRLQRMGLSSSGKAPFTPNADPTAAYHDACKRIDAVVERLQQPAQTKLGEIDPRAPLSLNFESNFTQPQFEDAVRKGKEYIKAGDIFQFVPSQRLRVHSKADPFDVYRALRIINPSPFMFYLKGPQSTLIGSSPEILCRVEGRIATTRPLAGTRKRGATSEEDDALEKELLADPEFQGYGIAEGFTRR